MVTEGSRRSPTGHSRWDRPHAGTVVVIAALRPMVNFETAPNWVFAAATVVSARAKSAPGTRT